MHPQSFEFLYGGFEFAAGFFAELQEADVADLVFTKRKLLVAIDVLDHVHLDLFAGELHFPGDAGAGAVHGEQDVRARLAAQRLHRLRQSSSLRALAVNFENAVASKNACLEPRRIVHGSDDGEETVAHGNDHADAAKAALRVVLQVLEALRVHELTVRIKLTDHALESVADKLLVSQLLAIHVISADALQHGGEEFEIGVGGVLRAGLLGQAEGACSNRQV